MRHINLILKIIVLYFFCTASALSRQHSYFRIQHEINNFEDHASGIAFIARNKKTSTETGISISKITSNKPLESANRHDIYPVYGFANIFFEGPISPFLELGIDLGDFLLDKANEGHAFDSDIYYSAGLKIKFSEQFYLAVYAKTYELYFNEINDITVQNTKLEMKGISMGFYF